MNGVVAPSSRFHMLPSEAGMLQEASEVASAHCECSLLAQSALAGSSAGAGSCECPVSCMMAAILLLQHPAASKDRRAQ